MGQQFTATVTADSEERDIVLVRPVLPGPGYFQYFIDYPGATANNISDIKVLLIALI